MAATVRSAGVANSGSTTATTINATMPAGFVAGDLLIGIMCNGTGATPSARPSGSTSVQNIIDTSVFGMDIVRKVAVGGDTFSWTIGTSSKWAACVVAVTVGTYNTVTPIQANVGAAQGTTSSASFVTPSATPSNADTLTIAAFGQQGAATWQCNDTLPSMTELCDTATTATTAASLGVYRSQTPHAATSYTRTGTASLSSANGAAFMLHVNPAPVVIRPRRPRPNFRR